MEHGTEAVIFPASAVQGGAISANSGKLWDFFSVSQLLLQNPARSAVLSPAAGSRLGLQCRD